MLIGHYIQTLNFKGRTALPARLRYELGDKVIVSRWYEGSIAIFELSRWEKIVEQATRGVFVLGSARDTERFLLGGAYEVELDGQGRFVIPPPLRQHAGIVDATEVVFVGLGSRAEIWSKVRWEEREKYILENAEKLIEEVSKNDTR
ncbi:MAG: division/cell wall cluster transcriptional repressor MraZ [Candidatus Blackburnbacteria bacterium]|nr:division/cell wall cluster transcriptional repressor MraZ [Candidatus Blackburnbacteria bacterium]